MDISAAPPSGTTISMERPIRQSTENSSASLSISRMRVFASTWKVAWLEMVVEMLCST